MAPLAVDLHFRVLTCIPYLPKSLSRNSSAIFSVSSGLSSTIVSSAKLTHANRYLSSRITGFIQYEKIKVEQTAP